MSASRPSERGALAAVARRAGRAGIGATTAMRVAEDLRRRILAGELEPGQRIKIDEVAEACGVSHMPVRDALRQLEGEGVLVAFPHRGAIVKGVDARFVRDFYDLRAAVEGMLAERCAAAIDAPGLADLAAAVDRFEAEAERGAEAAVAANRDLHDRVNAVADNREALVVLDRGRVLGDALRVRYGYGEGRVDAIVREHRSLLRAIAKHDVERAGDIARAHCRRARDDLLAKLAGSRRP